MEDDYKDEFLPRLQKSFIYQTLESKCKEKDSEVTVLVNDAVSYANQRTKTIIKHMGEYTLHDSDHLFRVLHLMEILLTKKNIEVLSIPELMLLIISAFFHDIGMAPEEEEIINWKKVWDESPEFQNEGEETLFEGFKRFCYARNEQMEAIEKFIKQGKNTEADTLKSYILSEYIRQTHAERARDVIGKHWDKKIKFRDNDLTVELANICQSHDEDASILIDFDINYLCGSNIHANLSLIAVILRLADILDFDAKRTPSILFSHLYVRHPVSIKEWNKHRSIDAWEINSEIIQFSAKCTHPAIESSIHEFCNLIDLELSICNNIISKQNEFYKNKSIDINVKFPFKVNRDKIRTKKDIYDKPYYTYKDTKFSLSKNQVIDLLMGTKLYGNTEVALRELLQNSIDACLLRQAQEKKWGNTYCPEISVKYYKDEDEDILEIIDNGTGMDQYIIDNYYSKIGSSFYKSVDFYNLKSESNADFIPTSRFGIGILSCFMIADILEVDTRRVYEPHRSSEPINIIVEGQDSIFWIREGKKQKPGTTTKLFLRKAQNPWEEMDEDEFIKSVETVITNPPFKINIHTTSQVKVRDENSYKEVIADSLKDYTWSDNDNIRLFNIPISNLEKGIVGSSIVAILESKKKPTDSIELTSKDIEIDGELYTLEKTLRLSTDSITEQSKSITINEDGEIKEEDSFSHFVRSISKISLHGIEVPKTLFPSSWEMKPNQVKLSWPFPLIIVADISGAGDLDLNSTRTEIIRSDKWIKFEEELAFIICSEIARSVSKDYWSKLKNVLIKKTKNEYFLKSLNKIRK